MSTAFVLGNGLSRAGIDLEFLQTKGKIYGCNALYREFTPDVLVATDRPIADAIQKTGYANSNLFYTRHPIKKSGAKKIPQELWPYSSGPVALGIAAQNLHSVVYLLGFDLGPTPDNKFNNIYADTDFYKTSKSVPTYTENWIEQIIKIVNSNPNIQFFRVQGETTANVSKFDKVKNLAHQSLAEFLKQLNNG
jgi:hypothetical protein